MAEASMEEKPGNKAIRDALKRDWHDFKGKRLDGRVAEEWRLFLDWRRKQPIDTLTLERYTSLLSEGGGIYFTNLIERRTTRCGRFRPASSAGYGIYRVNVKPADGKRDEAPRFSIPGPNNRRAARAEVGVPAATSAFESSVRPVLVALSNYDPRPDLRPLEINFARKVAYMYNPGKLLALYKNEVIRRIGSFLDIRDDQLGGYQATQAIKDRLTVEWGVSVEDVCSWGIDELREWTLADGRPLDDDEIRLTREFEVSQKMTGFLYQRFGLSVDFEQKNLVYYGPPGTGKTHRVTEAITQRVLADGYRFEEMCEIVQFHPSYSYEDFIEGLKPVNVAGGGISLVVRPGVFKRFCKKAMDALREDRMKEEEPRTFYFVADEINRAELSRVLGEVLVCLEESKRIDFDKDGNETGLRVSTQYGYMAEDGEGRFGVPANLYFIGTMNDIDRSIDSFDMALRRRFAWVRTGCEYEVIRESVDGDKRADAYRDICERLNDFILKKLKLGQAYEIGHAYFMTIAGRGLSDASVRQLFDTRIEPLLSEYLRAEHPQDKIVGMVNEARSIFSLAPAAQQDASETGE